MDKNEPVRTLADLPAEAWDRLADKRIYFGHQSVGSNLVAGIETLAAEHAEIRLRVVSAEELAAIDGPAFAHGRVGQNRDPQSKNGAFRGVLVEGLGEQVEIAALKYCYVDVHKDTDVGTVFEAYRQTVDQIRAEFPQVLLVHMTVPLRDAPVSWKTKIKLALGKTDLWEFSDNIARHRFNEMMRAEYGPENRLFDLAKFESTRPDGSRESFEVGGERYFALVPAYTADGGHLNEAGRRFVAEQLLIFLAQL